MSKRSRSDSVPSPASRLAKSQIFYLKAWEDAEGSRGFAPYFTYSYVTVGFPRTLDAFKVRRYLDALAVPDCRDSFQSFLKASLRTHDPIFEPIGTKNAGGNIEEQLTQFFFDVHDSDLVFIRERHPITIALERKRLQKKKRKPGEELPPDERKFLVGEFVGDEVEWVPLGNTDRLGYLSKQFDNPLRFTEVPIRKVKWLYCGDFAKLKKHKGKQSQFLANPKIFALSSSTGEMKGLRNSLINASHKIKDSDRQGFRNAAAAPRDGAGAHTILPLSEDEVSEEYEEIGSDEEVVTFSSALKKSFDRKPTSARYVQLTATQAPALRSLQTRQREIFSRQEGRLLDLLKSVRAFPDGGVGDDEDDE
eukprot:TRINITY_DN893_c2_g1_i4.p1 TRINITY_DN893_c2_g1~~TRINITY_DN893_c2_g1_i4.p1  ORF type:complete len:364 (-),score=87.43 TRINITY_DN893_c2_g1_i4:254-1345(-)